MRPQLLAKAALFLMAFILVSPAPAQSQEFVIWQSPRGSFANNSDVRIVPGGPSVSIRVLFDSPGVHFVVIPLTVPSNVYVRKATICYENTSALTYIEQIRIFAITTPNLAPAPIVETIDLDLLDASCHTTTAASQPANWSPTGSLAIQLRVTVNDTDDEVRIGGIGLHVEPTSGSSTDRLGD